MYKLNYISTDQSVSPITSVLDDGIETAFETFDFYSKSIQQITLKDYSKLAVRCECLFSEFLQEIVGFEFIYLSA